MPTLSSKNSRDKEASTNKVWYRAIEQGFLYFPIDKS
jgi:hypothetical protein